MFNDCAATKGAVKSVVVNTTCSGTPPSAQLKRGTSVQLSINFNSDVDSASLTSKVHGIIAGIPVPFPLKNTDGCNGCNITCPVQKSHPYTYANTLDVLTSYPKIRVAVKWEIKDASNNDIVCIAIPVVIV